MIIVYTELHISIFRRKRAELSATLAVVTVALWSTHVVEQTLSFLPHLLLPAVTTVHSRRPEDDRESLANTLMRSVSADILHT
jgi:hypothetical protein